MTNKRITKKDKFKALGMAITSHPAIAEETREFLMEFINHELGLLENKSKSSTKSKAQKEREELMTEVRWQVLGLLGDGKMHSVTEMVGLFGHSTQRISAMTTKLVNEGVILRIHDKKATFFRMA